MDQGELIKLATDYMQIWNAGSESLLDRFAASNLQVEYTHFGKIYTGISEYKEILKMTYNSFPNIAITLKEVIPGEDNKKAIITWEYTGSHKSGNLFGADPSGKKVKVQGMTILDVKDGLVTRETEIVDNMSLIMQLGVVKT